MEAKASATNNLVEIESFLDSLFEGQEGYIYAPTKSADSEFWQTYFFKWPSQRKAAATHLLLSSKDKDAYVAPSIFKAPSDKKQAWKGSNYVWVEFDGNAPEQPPSGIPHPTFRIQSSVSRHEHWYWRLNSFEVDYHVLEGLAKQLTYTLDADKSGWDCSQVLRAPGTLHQGSSKRVKLLAANSKSYGYGDFRNLVKVPETAVINTTWEGIPDAQDVIAKYKWDEEALNLFRKAKQPQGSRSSAMTRLGFHCVEMGMTNDECYAILLNADERWGKYKTRNPQDRAKRLIGIITHCRSKKELESELRLTNRESFVSLGDFRNTSLRVKWLYKDFLSEQGLGIISAAPGIGKSTLSIRLGIAAVLAKDFLIWEFGAGMEGKRVGFLSLEMAGLECRKFIEDMWPSFSDDEKSKISDNFFILPLGYSLSLASKENQQMILDEIDKHNIDFLIVDSLKAATALDERKLDLFFDWVNKFVRNLRGVTVWLIHHNRKPPNEGSRKPKGLEDLYGDTFIGAHPTTVVSLWRRSKGIIEVIPMKIRLAEEQDPFTIKREKHLAFTIQERLSKTQDEEVKAGSGKF